MYTMDETYMMIARLHRNAHKKAMDSDFYLGIQMACSQILTAFNQTEGFAGHPYVEEVTKRIMEAHPALEDDDSLHIYIDGKWRDRKGIDR